MEIQRLGNLHHLVPSRLWRDYDAPAMREAVQRQLEATDHDLVQVEYVEMLHLLRGAAKWRPWVYTCHESLGLAAARERDRRRGCRAVLARYRAMQADAHEQALLRRVDHVVTLADTDAAHLRARGLRAPVAIVPSGLDAAPVPAARTVAAEPFTCLFVGYFRHEPNVDAAVWLCESILPVLQRTVPGARVRLVGREAPPRVSALADRPGVEVAGFVPDLAGALAAATVVALPLRVGGGLRGKLLEAWAAGRPVVATAVACDGTEAEHGIHCLVADDADAFAAAIARLFEDAALRSRLGQAGRALVESRHGLARVIDEYDAVYRAARRGAP